MKALDFPKPVERQHVWSVCGNIEKVKSFLLLILHAVICEVMFPDLSMDNHSLQNQVALRRQSAISRTHYPFAKWCELCVVNRSQQDGHSEQYHTETAHSCISFDFGYASRRDDDDKLCALFIHDGSSGAMHAVPTPQKGGRHFNYSCTEFCRFIVWCGNDTIALKCDQ